MKPPIDNQSIYSQILEFRPRKSDLRKVAILDAVIDCIAGEGIDNAMAQSVGRRAKMRRSHVAYYFPNRDSMVEAAVKFVIQTGQEITVASVLAATTPQEKLAAWVEATFLWFERYPKHPAVIGLMTYYSACLPKYKKLHTQIRQAGEERVVAILKSKRAKKGIGDAAARRLAQRTRYFVVGTFTDFFGTERNLDYEALKTQTIETVLTWAEEYWA